MSLKEFYAQAAIRAKMYKWRLGQAAFNYLVDVRPDLSEAVRATDKDPFYASDKADPRWLKFKAYVEANWGE